MEEEDLAIMKAYLSNEEQQALDEEKDAQLLNDNLEPISDDEEDDLEILQEVRTQATSERTIGQRRKSTTSDIGEEAQVPDPSNDEADLPLPNTQHRVSRRHRKRSRREDDQFVHY